MIRLNATLFFLVLAIAVPVAGQPSAEGLQIWTQETAGVEGAAEIGDLFGEVLATGDFDGNGFDDLVVGIPGEDVGALVSAGAIQIFYGSSSGLTAAANELWTADSSGVPGLAEAEDEMGKSLAVGDFDGDDLDDLAVGIPGEDVDGVVDAGAVLVFLGTPTGLQTTGAQLFVPSDFVAPGAVVAGEAMGLGLAAGDFDGDLRDDLAIGLPGDEVEGLQDAGSVIVLYGSATGPSVAGHDLIHLGSFPFSSPLEGGAFGASLAAGEVTGFGGLDDLVIGIPGVGQEGSGFGYLLILAGDVGGVSLDLNDAQVVTPLTNEASLSNWPIAMGDTDGDGADNVAVGLQGHDETLTDEGVVRFHSYGSRGSLYLDEVTTAEGSAFFGAGLAIADFDLDGLGDLLVGAPGLGLDGEAQGSGAVFYLPGGQGIGSDPSGSLAWSLQDLGLLESSVGDFLGSALAVGDFDGNGFPDAAFGLSGRDVGDQILAGTVVVLPSQGVFADGFESGDPSRWSP